MRFWTKARSNLDGRLIFWQTTRAFLSESLIVFKQIFTKKFRVNNKIQVPAIRLIDSNGDQSGVVPTERAMEKAQEEGLDLVEVSPNANPPVCKILDFGKFLYQQKKQEQQSRKAGKQQEMKFIRISPRIGEHDIETKARHAEKFLSSRHPVKIELRFRGREVVHPEVAREKFDRFLEKIESGTPEAAPKKQGHQMIVIINPSTKSQKNEA